MKKIVIIALFVLSLAALFVYFVYSGIKGINFDIIIVAALNFIITLIGTLAYLVRIVGVRTGKIAVSFGMVGSKILGTAFSFLIFIPSAYVIVFVARML